MRPGPCNAVKPQTLYFSQPPTLKVVRVLLLASQVDFGTVRQNIGAMVSDFLAGLFSIFHVLFAESRFKADVPFLQIDPAVRFQQPAQLKAGVFMETQ